MASIGPICLQASEKRNHHKNLFFIYAKALERKDHGEDFEDSKNIAMSIIAR